MFIYSFRIYGNIEYTGGEGMKKQGRKSASSENLRQLYEAKGYRMLTHSDLSNRLFSFLIDTIIMLAPIMIWNIIMMAVLGSIVSISGIIIINIIIGILLVISILLINTYIYIQTGGQSIGKRMFDMKLVRKNGKDATKRQIMLREIVGFAIPFIVGMFFLNAVGVAAFWCLNTLIVLIDKRQRTWIDFVLGTNVVAIVEHKAVTQQAQKVEVVKKPEKDIVRNCSFDLHIHSNFSVNGELNVEEIFQLAAKKQLKTISITDLDCAKSNSIAKRMSALYHVNYVPGIEINCQLHGTRLRVLAYFIDYNNELYATIENESLMYEKNASIQRVRKFESLLGRRIDIDRLLSSNRFQKIPAELIAKHVLSRPEYRDCELLQPYINNQGGAYRQLAKDYFSYGKPCYVVAKYPNLEDVLDVVEMTGGISVLAYPGKLLTYEEKTVNEAIAKGIQGLEVFHPAHSKKEMAELLRYAMDHKLFITGGSGFYNYASQCEIGKFACPSDAERIIEDFISAKQ